MKTRICDICEFPIGNCGAVSFKIKGAKRKTLEGWEPIDICAECVGKIVDHKHRRASKVDIVLERIKRGEGIPQY